MPAWFDIRPRDEGVLLHVHVQPGARVTCIQGLHGGRLKLRVAAPPVDGAANEEVLRFLRSAAGLRRSAVTLVNGQTSRQKDVLLAGLGGQAWESNPLRRMVASVGEGTSS